MVIGDEAKDAALRVFGGFVIERSVFEVEGQMRLYAIATHDFDKITVGEDLALFRAQSQEAVQCPLRMKHLDRLGSSKDREDENQHRDAPAASNTEIQVRSMLQIHCFVDGLGDEAVALEQDPIKRGRQKHPPRSPSTCSRRGDC